MDKKPYLSVIIPVYSEVNWLPITLVDIDKHLRDVDFDYEILVVNGGFGDSAINIIRKFEPIVKGLRLAGREVNKKEGYIIREGMREAKGRFRLFMDADNATSVEHFFNMIPYLEGKEEEKYDIIIGSRNMKDSKPASLQPWRRYIMSDILNIIIRAFLLYDIRDARHEFKCFSEEAIERIFPLMKINRPDMGVEALVLGKKIGYKIKEIPVTWTVDVNKRIKTSDYINIIIDALKIRFWLWTNKYKII